MSAEYPAGVTSVYGETLALSSALASLGMPGFETKQAIIYVPSLDYRLHVNPALKAAYVYDNSQTGIAKWIDKTATLQDRASVGTGTAMDTLTASDRLFLCFSEVTGGFWIDVTSPNGGSAQSLTCSYWNGTAWTDLSANDGTTDATRSLTKDDAVTWTAPTDAVFSYLGGPNNIKGNPAAIIDSGINIGTDPSTTERDVVMDGDPSSAIVAGDFIYVDTEIMYVNSSSATGNIVNVNRGALGSTIAAHTAAASVYIYNIAGPAVEGFWVECKWDVSMDSDTEIGNIWALNKNTKRGYFRAGVEYPMSFDRRNVGSIEAVLAAGDTTMQVTWIRTII